MEQIYHTMTDDNMYEVNVFTDGIFTYMYIGDKKIYTREDSDQTFETLDYEHYVGVADCYYEKHNGKVNFYE